MISRPEQKSLKTEWYLFSRDKILTKGQEASASAYHMETNTIKNWDAQNSEMNALYEGTLSKFTEGSIITGKIIRVHDGDVTIDIGYKSEGVIDINEFKDLGDDPVGHEVDVYLERLEDDDGVIVISKNALNNKRLGNML